MKKIIKKIVHSIVGYDYVYKLLDITFLRLCRYIIWTREKSKSDRETESAVNEMGGGVLLNGDRILNGPFTGMCYPQDHFTCFAFYPKLLGSYEAELHPFFDDILNETHFVREVDSIDDIRKVDVYDYDELKNFGLKDKYRILAEWRPRIMKWMYAVPKQQGNK